MADTSTMLQALQSALAHDVIFGAWCQASGSPATIQIEVADLERLDDADFPFVGIFDVVQDGGIVTPELSWSLKLLCGIRNPALVSSQVGNCTLKTYSGRLEVEDLREEALAALFRAGLGFNIKLEGASVPNQFHPRYYSAAQLTVKTIKAI